MQTLTTVVRAMDQRKIAALAAMTRALLEYRITQWLPLTPPDVSHHVREIAPMLHASEQEIEEAIASVLRTAEITDWR